MQNVSKIKMPIFSENFDQIINGSESSTQPLTNLITTKNVSITKWTKLQGSGYAVILDSITNYSLLST